MPTVTANGKKFTFPDGVTPDQMGEAIDEYFSSGDQPKESVQTEDPSFLERVSEMFTGGKRSTAQTKSLPELQSSGLLFGEDQPKVAAISPALLTATDPNEIAQIITSNFPNVGVSYNKDGQGNVYPVLVNNKTGAATVINRPGTSAMDVLQAIGIGAAFTPASRAATVAGAVGKSAITEGAIQTSQAASGGELNEEDVLISGAIGGVGKALENVVRTGVRAAKEGVSGPQADLIRQADSAGVPLMTSDVLPPETFAARAMQNMGEKIPFVGTGPARAQQQAARSEALDNLTGQYGNFSYQAIVDSLKAQKDKVKQAAGSVLEGTARQIDVLGPVNTNRTISEIRSAYKELVKPGAIVDRDAVNSLEQVVEAMSAQAPNFSGLKELRTTFRDIVKKADAAERSQLTSRSKALLGKVLSAMSEDLTGAARAALSPQDFAKWQRANSVYAEEAQKLTKTKLKNILDKGDVTPESVKGMLFSKNESELDTLYKSLTTEGKRNARAAIINQITDALSKRVGGVSPTSFATESKKYKKQINTFFKGAERAQLRGLIDVLDATRRAQDTNVLTQSGQQLLGPAAIGATVANPAGTILGGLTMAAFGRAYESKPMRNLLIKIANAPKGTREYDRLIEEAAANISRFGQVIDEPVSQ